MILTDTPKGFERDADGLQARVSAGTVLALDATSDGGPVVEGFGSVANQATDIQGAFSAWSEVVEPGAWAKSVAEGDVRSMMNHDTNWLLGRTKAGTLRLEDNADGLWYSVDINPDDPNAMSVHARVARGDISGSSVWFRVVRQEWTMPTEDNGLDLPVRRILEGALFETGPVVFPAFEQTSSQARALAPFDTVLRSVGVTSAGKRARILSDLVADPDSIEAELRHLFASAPDLRSAVCACQSSGRADDPSPSGAEEPSPDRAARANALARARHLALIQR